LAVAMVASLECGGSTPLPLWMFALRAVSGKIQSVVEPPHSKSGCGSKRTGHKKRSATREEPTLPRPLTPYLQPLFYQAQCAKALLDSAILIVFSRLVMASPSRR